MRRPWRIALMCLNLKEDEKAYYNLAQVYEKLEMYNEAEQAYRQLHAEEQTGWWTHISPTPSCCTGRRNMKLRKWKSTRSCKWIQSTWKESCLQSQILSAQGNYPKASEALSMASIALSR